MITEQRIRELLAESKAPYAILGGNMPTGLLAFARLVEAEGRAEFEGWRLNACQFHDETPIDMVLYCPRCCTQHIDKDEAPTIPDEGGLNWHNPPHRSHLCHSCGFVWRPADVPTNGVQAVKTTGKADHPLLPPLPVSRNALADGTERPCPHPSWANKRLTTGDGTPVDYCTLCKRNRIA